MSVVTNNKITILRVANLTESACRACRGIVAQSLPMVAEAFRRRATRDVNRGRHILFVAQTPGAIVGLIMGFTFGASAAVHAQVDCLCVDRRYRGTGIGDSLLAAYEKYVRDEYGAAYVCLKSAGRAVTFYKNRGYCGDPQYMRKDFSR